MDDTQMRNNWETSLNEKFLDKDVAEALIALMGSLPMQGTPDQMRAELELRDRAINQLRSFI